MKKRKFKNGFDFFMFTIPAIIVILLFVEIPFLMSVFYSFTKWNGLDRHVKFIGFKNYVELFQDKDMIQALGFTLLFTVFFVILTNIIAMVLAFALDSDIKGKNVFRAIFYIPNIISLVVIGFIWRFIYSRVFDSLYNITHLSFFNLSWLGNSRLAFISVVFVSVWQAIGFYLVIYIAGLQSLPADVIEAAKIDGASGIKRFFHVTLPLIMPSITICVFFAIANALKNFEVIFSLTYGGPGTSTTTIALDIYKTAFVNNRFGYGTAKSVILFLIVMIITVTQVTIFKQKEVEA